MAANFRECDYLFKDNKDIVKEFPIKLNPKNILKHFKKKIISFEKK